MKSCIWSDRIQHVWISAFLLILLAAGPAYPQGFIFKLDFDSSNDSILHSTIDAPPSVIRAADGPFTVTVVLTGASKLVGANCDLIFNPDQLRVVNIQESYGDVNFDGRSNVFDIREVGARVNSAELYEAYYDRVETYGVLDMADVNAIAEYFAKPGKFWTVNTDDTTIRESVEIFEEPSISNQNGRIDDIVCVLLPREHPEATEYKPVEGEATFFGPAGFGFNGDARIAEITFQPVTGFSGTTTLTFADKSAITEESVLVITRQNGVIIDQEIIGMLEPADESVELSIK